MPSIAAPPGFRFDRDRSTDDRHRQGAVLGVQGLPDAEFQPQTIHGVSASRGCRRPLVEHPPGRRQTHRVAAQDDPPRRRGRPRPAPTTARRAARPTYGPRSRSRPRPAPVAEFSQLIHNRIFMVNGLSGLTSLYPSSWAGFHETPEAVPERPRTHCSRRSFGYRRSTASP